MCDCLSGQNKKNQSFEGQFIALPVITRNSLRPRFVSAAVLMFEALYRVRLGDKKVITYLE